MVDLEGGFDQLILIDFDYHSGKRLFFKSKTIPYLYLKPQIITQLSHEIDSI